MDEGSADEVFREMRKCTIGVMGSSTVSKGEVDDVELGAVAVRLGEAIALRGCLLLTGATTGLPDMVSRAAMRQGGLTIGISPATSETEHINQYHYPIDAAEVIIYTGFGLKGRNVINIRSSDIVVIIGGGMGTLNEMTIAYDEGKIIGVLEGTGGITAHIREIIRFAQKESSARLVYASDPERLIEECLAHWQADRT